MELGIIGGIDNSKQKVDNEVGKVIQFGRY